MCVKKSKRNCFIVIYIFHVKPVVVNLTNMEIAHKMHTQQVPLYSHGGRGKGGVSSSVHILHLTGVHMLHLDNEQTGD